MPKYAQFDKNLPHPQKILGWYDTDEFNYPNLPDKSCLLELTKAQWNNRHNTPFIDKNKLIAEPVVELTKEEIETKKRQPLISDAHKALHEVDRFTLRCYQSGIAFPFEWKKYLKDLRDIASGKDKKSLALPKKPSYPDIPDMPD